MWCEDRGPQGSLISSLDLYNFACVKDAFVADHLKISSGSYHWNVSFSRSVYDCEVKVFVLFLNLLYSFKLGQGGERQASLDPPKEACLTLDCSTMSLSLLIALSLEEILTE